jgi:enoyl-CoA hydratase/carnithine racemase
VSRLREIAERLGTIARELEGEETGDERARELAREAAELSAEAVEEANLQIRQSSGE